MINQLKTINNIYLYTYVEKDKLLGLFDWNLNAALKCI